MNDAQITPCELCLIANWRQKADADVRYRECGDDAHTVTLVTWSVSNASLLTSGREDDTTIQTLKNRAPKT